MVTDFAAAKTAILCSNQNPSVKQWIGSALLWARQSPEICVCEMFPPQHHPEALLCINPCVWFKKCSCKPSSLVVQRWSQLVQRHQLILVSELLQQSRAFLHVSSEMREKVVLFHWENWRSSYRTVKNKTRLWKDFHQWATFASPLVSKDRLISWNQKQCYTPIE